MMVDIFWLVVNVLVNGGGWLWVIVGGDGWW